VFHQLPVFSLIEQALADVKFQRETRASSWAPGRRSSREENVGNMDVDSDAEECMSDFEEISLRGPPPIEENQPVEGNHGEPPSSEQRFARPDGSPGEENRVGALTEGPPVAVSATVLVRRSRDGEEEVLADTGCESGGSTSIVGSVRSDAGSHAADASAEFAGSTSEDISMNTSDPMAGEPQSSGRRVFGRLPECPGGPERRRVRFFADPPKDGRGGCSAQHCGDAAPDALLFDEALLNVLVDYFRTEVYSHIFITVFRLELYMMHRGENRPKFYIQICTKKNRQENL